MRWVTAALVAAFLGCTAAVLAGLYVPALAYLTPILVLAKGVVLAALVFLALAAARPEWLPLLAASTPLLLAAVPLPTQAVAPVVGVLVAAWGANEAWRAGRNGICLALGLIAMLCAGRGALELLLPERAPWAAAAVAAVIGAALAVRGLFALSLRVRPVVLASAACFAIAISGAVAARLAPAARFNVTMALFVVGFILAAAAVAALFTWLFLKAFERLDRDLFQSCLFFLPVCVAPVYLVGESLSGWGPAAETPAWRWGALAVAADTVLLLALLLLLAIRGAGRRIGPGNPILRTAWKFLRSQQMVRTAATRRDLALRRLIPATRPGRGELFGWGSLAALLLPAAGFAVAPLLSTARFPACLWQGGSLALSAAWFSGLALAAATAAGRWHALPATLLALAAAFQLRRAGIGDEPFLRWLPVAASLLPLLLLAMQYATRAVLSIRRARGTLHHNLDPRFAPEIRTRMREGVGASIFASVVGVAIGVWALIVVLSVMAGFSGELQDRIIRTKEHLRVSARDGLQAPFDLAGRIAAMDGVLSASPYVEGEAMMSSSLNISSTVTIRGIVPGGAGADELERTLVAGTTAFLRHPEDLVPFPSLPPASRFFPDDVGDPSNEGAPAPTLDAPDGLLPMPDIPDEEEVSPASPAPSPGIPAPDGLVPLPPLPLADEDEAAPLHPADSLSSSRYDVEVQPSVIIGIELARSLGASVGSRITLISPDGEIGPMGVQPRARSFHVAGIFSTGMYEYDLKLSYTTLSEAQRFFDLGDRIDLVDVRLLDLAAADRIRDTLLASDFAAGLEVRTLQEMNRNLFSALKLERIVMFVVLGFIILIASFNIVASLLILIWKRTGTIAILRTMGAVRRDVMTIFFLLGAASGLFGIASGVIMGLSSCGVIRHLGLTLPKEYYIRSLPVQVDGLQVLLVAAAALLITVGAALYPGRLAARIELVQGLKDER